MSHRGVSIGRSPDWSDMPPRTTKVGYRRELRPVITTGAEIVDKFSGGS
jgi:hypothetical protein